MCILFFQSRQVSTLDMKYSSCSFQSSLSIESHKSVDAFPEPYSMVIALQTVLYPQWSVVKVMQMIIFFIIFPFWLLSTMDLLVGLNPCTTFGHPNSHSHTYTILFVADIDNSVKSITYYLSIRFHKTTMSGILKTLLHWHSTLQHKWLSVIRGQVVTKKGIYSIELIPSLWFGRTLLHFPCRVDKMKHKKSRRQKQRRWENDMISIQCISERLKSTWMCVLSIEY